VRLNQFLAAAGYGSRRSCEDLIREGRVFLNGQRVTQLATRVDLRDSVKVDGKQIRQERPLTAALHKPAGYLCTADDPQGRPTIYDLLPKNWPRIFYVGRLDGDSEGLLLVTNDGALSQRLAHPSFKLPKLYEVQLDREFDFALADKLKKGVVVDGQKARMDEIHRIGPKAVKVVLTQGIKRQIRLMFELVGFKVKRLVRTKIGTLELGDLEPGKWRILSESEIQRHFGDRSKPRGGKSAARG
jgi:23S rRNA pseudouridine2605 synthase